ncbi:alpha-(1,3)-fucosyltransferase 10 isoform X2 [Chelonus insularis]|nr:alpha-(1,3)-fucosyltransferase 10 isoform X2 [Chelonus insularis]
MKNLNLKAMIFYGSNFDLNDLPIPRKPNVKWALFHEESPRNNLMFVHEEALKLFNYSATFSRFSDVPLTLLELPGEDELQDKSYFYSTPQKNLLMKQNNLAPVLFIQSNCDTMNDRDLYVTELMKYIAVDSYGSCMNNKKLPDGLEQNYLDKLKSREFLQFVAQYKFTLAFENANCDDYITEKLWRPLIVGSVPIYYGSASFKDWLPNDKSAIAVTDFKHPRDLADYIKQLLHDDRKYELYLRHKLSENGITNEHLLENLRSRPQYLFSIFEYYVRRFECVICQKIHKNSVQTMTRKQYNCSKPKSIFNNKEKKESSWTLMWELEACTAKLLNYWLSHNKTFNSNQFNKEKLQMYENKKCYK